jgi:hypothetical protein
MRWVHWRGVKEASLLPKKLVLTTTREATANSRPPVQVRAMLKVVTIKVGECMNQQTICYSISLFVLVWRPLSTDDLSLTQLNVVSLSQRLQ